MNIRKCAICSSVKYLLFFVCLLSLHASAEVVPDQQLWVNVNAAYRFKEKWQVYGEYQPRYMDDRKYLSLYYLRLMLVRELRAGFSTGLGYGYSVFDHYPNPKFIHEDRFWLQLGHSFEHNRINVANRTRMEQRWFRHDDHPSYRLRHMLRLSYAVSKHWRLISYDEWFWNANSIKPSARSHQSRLKEGFDQNRFFLGIGYALGDKQQHLVELGYLQQYVNGTTLDRSHDVIATQLNFKF